MAITAAAVTAAAAVAAAGTGIAGAAMGPDAGPTGRLKLGTPELEFSYLKSIGPQIAGIDKDIKKTATLEAALVQKNNIERKRVSGVIPTKEELDHLENLNRQIVDAFGGNTQELLKNGLMTAEDLASSRGEGPINPAIEESIKAGEVQLRDQLRRELGPGYETTEAGRRALGEFQKQAQSQRFEGAQQGLTMRLASRQQGLAEAMAGYNAAGSSLDRERGAFITGSQYLTSLNAADYQAGLTAIGARTGLRDEKSDVYKTLGAFDLSSEAKKALNAGIVGPGTVYKQSGLSEVTYRDKVGSIPMTESQKELNQQGIDYINRRSYA